MKDEILVNELPAKTWNRLQVNASTLCLPEHWDSCEVKIEKKHTKGIAFYRNNPCKQQIKTGMGESLSAVFQTNDTLVIHENSKEETPVIVTYTYEEKEAFANMLTIEAKDNSKQQVILVFQGEREAMMAHRLQVSVGINAELSIYTVQVLENAAAAWQDFGADIQQQGNLSYHQIVLGAKSCMVGNAVTLTGRQSQFASTLHYALKKEQQLDLNLLAQHIGKKSQSKMEVSGVLEDSAKKIFRGTIDFVKGCVDAKGAETEEVLLLGEHVVNQTVPLILCAEEKVEGNHGAAIGNLDEQTLFYLQTRGISREAAIRMLAKARIQAASELIPSQEVREMVRAKNV